MGKWIDIDQTCPHCGRVERVPFSLALCGSCAQEEDARLRVECVECEECLRACAEAGNPAGMNVHACGARVAGHICPRSAHDDDDPHTTARGAKLRVASPPRA